MLIYRNAEGVHGQIKFDNTCPKPPQTKLQAHPNWNMKHYKSVEFLSIFIMSSHPPETQTPLLKTFWWWFCLNLGDSDRL